MAHISKDFCKRVAAVRREHGLTQSALALKVGCAQSAVSMFESGHPEKLSMEFVEKIAELLKITFEERAIPDAFPEAATVTTKKSYCPNTACLSNIPYVVNGELFIWPELTAINDQIKYCATCGEVLERSCPKCGSAVSEGACCRSCGHARVMTALPPGTDPEKWVEARRDEIQQWRSLTGDSRF